MLADIGGQELEMTKPAHPHPVANYLSLLLILFKN